MRQYSAFYFIILFFVQRHLITAKRGCYFRHRRNVEGTLSMYFLQMLIGKRQLLAAIYKRFRVSMMPSVRSAWFKLVCLLFNGSIYYYALFILYLFRTSSAGIRHYRRGQTNVRKTVPHLRQKESHQTEFFIP